MTGSARYALPISMLLLCFLPVYGQDVTGTIAGTVTDATGAAMPDAIITVSNVGTNATHKGVTTSLGTYSIRTLPVGEYRLSAEAKGFRRFEASGIRLQVNEVARVDITMQVGQLSDAVEVHAAVIAVDTQTATLKTVVDQKRVEDLPLNGRDPVQLMRLVAGVSVYNGSDVTSSTMYPGVVPVSVNGNRGNSTNYVLDGGQNNDHYNNAPNPMPNPDALQEFSVQTNNFSAEFGRQSGGVVNALTKSGTNDLHSTAFWYVRNNALNAANFFAPAKPGKPNEKQDDGLKRNQFGVTAGGPVVLPKLYNGKDKTFFFFSYQGGRIRRSPTSTSVNVLTAKERTGDFSEWGSALKDPNGGVFPGNIIPATRFYAPSKYIIDNHIPVAASGRSVVTTNIQNSDDNQYLAKVDQQIGSNLRLSGRGFWSMAHQPGNLTPNNFYEKTDIRDWNNRSYVGNAQWTLSPTLLNQTIVSYNFTDGPASHVYPTKNWKDFGIDITVDPYTQYYLPFQTISQIDTGDTNNFIRKEWQFGNTTRWSKGRHSVAFGGEYHQALGDVVNNYRSQGRFYFTRTAGYTGFDVSDFLLGRWAEFIQGVGEFKNTRFKIFNLFVNDSIKVTRRLTADLGVRWEPFLPNTDELGKLAVWGGLGAHSTRFVNAPPGVLYPGDPGIPDGGYAPTWGNYGPRVGLAFDLTGDGKTSLRLGYGVFFDRLNTLQTNSAATQAPFGTVVGIYGQPNDTMAKPYANVAGGNPFPKIGFDAVGTEVLNPGKDVRFILPVNAFLYASDNRNPYVQSWNITLERQIFGNWVVRGSYAGSNGTALVSGRDINAPLPDATASTSTTNQRRPLYPNYGSMIYVEPSGRSFYNSGQFTVEKRFSQGFTVLANYTYAKTIDNDQGSGNKGNGTTVTDPRNKKFDRGPADFDLRHVYNFSGLWQVPGKFKNRGLQFLIGGWDMTGIIAWRSGFPFTVVSGQDNARVGTSSGQRAELTGVDPYLNGSDHGIIAAQYLNKTAFKVNTLGTFGTLGRNTYRGPRSFNTDVGLHKDFPMTERAKWQFRFEAFNVFNNVNLSLPNSTVTASNFMRITSAASPRILQLALRLEF